MKALPFVDFQRDVLKVSRTLQQRVLFKVGIDHVDPCTLPDDERSVARDLFGEVDTIPASARGTFALLKGARVGGTLAGGEMLLWAALTVDLSGLAAGEQAFSVAVAPDMKLANQPLRYALGAAKAAPDIARLIKSESADGFTLRRHDGRLVSIERLAASRGGTGLRGRTLAACLMDESSFFYDADSGVVNDAELERAVSPRIVPGGKLMITSTAWMRSGLLWDLVQKNHGDPKTCVAAIAPTLFLRPNDQKVASEVAKKRESDPENAAREFDCVPFGGGAAAFIDATAIDRMVSDSLPIGGAL